MANRRIAIEAAEADIDVDNDQPMSQLRGIKLALTDPKTYLLALAYHGQTGAAGIQNYFPTLTQTITSTHIEALLLCAPPYLFMVVWSFVHCRVSDRFGHRFWFFVYPIPITIVGFVSTWETFSHSSPPPLCSPWKNHSVSRCETRPLTLPPSPSRAVFMSASNFAARYFSLFLQIFVFAMNGTLYACTFRPPSPPPP